MRPAEWTVTAEVREAARRQTGACMFLDGTERSLTGQELLDRPFQYGGQVRGSQHSVLALNGRAINNTPPTTDCSDYRFGSPDWAICCSKVQLAVG